MSARNVSPLTKQATNQSNPYALVAERLAIQHNRYAGEVPLTMKQAKALTKCLLSIMFPHFAETSCQFELANDIAELETRLAKAIGKALPKPRQKDARALAEKFLLSLSDIAAQCWNDANALLEGDPAARSLDEVILAYPGFYATAIYRLANALWRLDIPIIPRMLSEAAHHKTGIDIHPGATIGDSFYIDHGTGVVIGETTIIGNNVKIYQGVTLGGLRIEKDSANAKRHPTLEDNVVVYAGATILGGDTIVGNNSIVGGNVWLTRSVSPWSRVMFKSCDQAEIIPIDSRKKA